MVDVLAGAGDGGRGEGGGAARVLAELRRRRRPQRRHGQAPARARPGVRAPPQSAASAEEEVRDEVFNQISNYEEILLTAKLYHLEANKFGFEVELDATNHVSMEEIQEVGKDEFDDENYFLGWVVNEYEGKLYDWADEKYDGGFPDDITEAILEAEAGT